MAMLVVMVVMVVIVVMSVMATIGAARFSGNQVRGPIITRPFSIYATHIIILAILRQRLITDQVPISGGFEGKHDRLWNAVVAQDAKN